MARAYTGRSRWPLLVIDGAGPLLSSAPGRPSQERALRQGNRPHPLRPRWRPYCIDRRSAENPTEESSGALVAPTMRLAAGGAPTGTARQRAQSREHQGSGRGGRHARGRADGRRFWRLRLSSTTSQRESAWSRRSASARVPRDPHRVRRLAPSRVGLCGAAPAECPRDKGSIS